MLCMILITNVIQYNLLWHILDNKLCYNEVGFEPEVC